MNQSTGIAIAAVAIVLVGGLIFYQQQQQQAAAQAFNRSLGGAISNTIGGVGSIVGAVVNLGASGAGGNA